MARCSREGFPPRSTVYNIFRKFQREGTWEAIWAELHVALRERMGREASPSAAVLDSQSLKSAETYGPLRRQAVSASSNIYPDIAGIFRQQNAERAIVTAANMADFARVSPDRARKHRGDQRVAAGTFVERRAQ